MVKSSTGLKLLKRLNVYLRSDTAKEQGRVKTTAFSRRRKLTFTRTVGLLLNSLKKSLQIELDDFFEYVLGSEETVTKQAFSKARQNIRPEFFKETARIPVNTYYEDGKFRSFHGFRLLAVDSTTLDLPDFENLREHFGHMGNRERTVRARGSGLFDVENSIILAAEIDGWRTDERTLARRHLAELKAMGRRNDLLLYDRGYPSREWLAYHLDEGYEFVMRAKDAFLHRKQVYQGGRDYLQSFRWNGKNYVVRRIVFLLESGERETLITSPLPAFSMADLQGIYEKRWGIETEYYYLKHRLQIENFSGYSLAAVLQDFYASICLNNIAAVFSAEVEPGKMQKRKYTHKANRNILLGKLKNRLVKALFVGGEALSDLFVKLCAAVAGNTIPIRKGRSFPRVEGWKRLKHPPNMRFAI